MSASFKDADMSDADISDADMGLDQNEDRVGEMKGEERVEGDWMGFSAEPNSKSRVRSPEEEDMEAAAAALIMFSSDENGLNQDVRNSAFKLKEFSDSYFGQPDNDGGESWFRKPARISLGLPTSTRNFIGIDEDLIDSSDSSSEDDRTFSRSVTSSHLYVSAKFNYKVYIPLRIRATQSARGSTIEDCPDPFSTAMKMIKDRGKINMQRVLWTPKGGLGPVRSKLAIPSLQELSTTVLLKNVDAVSSLQYIPDELRHRLCQLLCDSRRMTSQFLKLLTQGQPTEICLSDCSWITEEDFIESFEGCDTGNLMVLQLDHCGRCIVDYVLSASIAQSPDRLPKLASLSITCALRLTDSGLRRLVSSAPALRSVNISRCSLLTSASIKILADNLRCSLRELYLDDCQDIDVRRALRSLKKLKYLEVLSVAGIPSICDDFIVQYINRRGRKMKELVLADCRNLTDSSVKVIADHCPNLHVLDLSKLYKLTDSSVRYLTNGGQAFHTLRFCGNRFSDEAIAAFLETAGRSIKELSLNKVQKVSHNTAISLANCATILHTLDLSWCRNLTDEAVGLIVDSCLSLKELKLFGCSQITDFFLNGHSNAHIKIFCLKTSPKLHSVEVHDF